MSSPVRSQAIRESAEREESLNWTARKEKNFDFIDQFIADYAIDIERAEKSMSVPALDIARMIVDIHVSRKEILELISGITPAKMVEVMNHLNVVELMMGMQKIRAQEERRATRLISPT